MSKRSAVIATIKSWNIARAEELRKKLGTEWEINIITIKDHLSFEALAPLRPEYVFFPHWSWMIPERVYSAFQCVVFHMTDLPFGRGGSPLQNLIMRGIGQTKITALRAEKGADTGPIYLKRELDISRGSANEILDRASRIVFDEMIPQFLAGKVPVSTPQEGEIVEFIRRKPGDSDISRAAIRTERQLYDFIRMLDGEGYPPAFIDLGDIRIEFKNVVERAGGVNGFFEVKKNEGK